MERVDFYSWNPVTNQVQFIARKENEMQQVSILILASISHYMTTYHHRLIILRNTSHRNHQFPANLVYQVFT